MIKTLRTPFVPCRPALAKHTPPWKKLGGPFKKMDGTVRHHCRALSPGQAAPSLLFFLIVWLLAFPRNTYGSVGHRI